MPVASWDSGLALRRAKVWSVLNAGWRVGVTSGTAAIALALKHADIKSGDKVLLPAFHCRSMIEPFVAIGARLDYYHISENLAVDTNDIHSKLDSRSRVLLVTHYFGFYQDMQSLRTLCDKLRVILIEDCAHAFFGVIGGYPVGWHGDYTIASARKFFAIQDGGYLISNRHSIENVVLKTGGWMHNMKAALDVLETAMAYGRLKPLSFLSRPFLALKFLLWNGIKTHHSLQSPLSIGPGVSAGYKHLDLAWVYARMSLASHCIVYLSDKDRIAAKRRAHYRRLASGLSHLPGVRPLFPDLSDHVVPYMFPLLVNAPDMAFALLKRNGVPIWRWEDIEPSSCDVSRRYSRCLFQLPCHQALRDSETDWIIENVKQITHA